MAMNNRSLSILTILLLAGGIAAPAYGGSVRFGDWQTVTAGESSGGYVPTIDTQLQITVSDQTANGDLLVGEVRFTFENLGPMASSITDVFFQDGEIIGAADPLAADGVNFVERDGDPASLPGGELINFDATRQFSRAFEPTDGIDPGEQLTLYLKLLGGQTYEDVLSALQRGGASYPNSMPNGGLRVGIHIETPGALDGASFVMVTVPLPGAAWAGFVLLGTLGGWQVFRSGARNRALD